MHVTARKYVVGIVVAIVAAIVAGGAFGAQQWIISTGSQIKDGVIPASKLTPAARQSLQGDQGDRGLRGLRGLPGQDGTNGVNGLPGAIGAKGDQGNTGPAGANGAAGSNGVDGSNGAAGSQGPAGADGATGPAGAQGPSGVNNPLVYGPYASGSNDSSVCGGDWATDTYTVTYIVSPRSDGSFDVTKLYDGTFVTLAGDSPNDCAVQVADGITGTFHGDYALTVAAGSDFNAAASCPAGCTTDAFFSAFFGLPVPGSYAWQFYYTTASNGSWANTDHGNTGNIS